ncbi:hypothetical protein HDU91_006666 [Kappamyces sp. JEL0680]|nr:hypothetical protein HDU91_006666 [Kappamyces sp. JEL0680]
MQSPLLEEPLTARRRHSQQQNHSEDAAEAYDLEALSAIGAADIHSAALPVSTPFASTAATIKLEYIEGLRGFCAFIVCVHHFVIMFFDFGGGHGTLIELLINGHAAVTCFFILSGRVLCLAVLAKQRRDPTKAFQSLSSAVFRRPIRLVLPLFFAANLSFFLHWAGFYAAVPRAAAILQFPNTPPGKAPWLSLPPQFPSLSWHGVFWISILLNAIGLEPSPKYNLYPAKVIWSIPIELACSYIVYSFTLMLLSLRKRHHLFYALAIAWFWYINSWSCVFLTGVYICQLSIDGYLARIQTSKYIWLYRMALVLASLAPMTKQLPLFAWFHEPLAFQYYDNYFQRSTGGMIGGKASRDVIWFEQDNAVSFSCASVVLLFELTPALQRLFSTRPFQFLGRISFGLYLGHPLVMWSILSWAIVFLTDTLGLSFYPVMVLCIPIYLAGSFLFGWAFSRSVDKASIDASHWVRNTLFVG